MIQCTLIGCGYWGSKLKRYLEENPTFRLKYVADSSFDLTTIWRDEEVSAVIIAVPNEARFSITSAALKAGKHVLSEKPLALTTGECETLARLAAEKSVVLTVEYTYTFSRALAKAQRVVDAGNIGRVLGMEMSVRHLGRFGGGSVYWLLGSHMLAALDLFFPLSTLEFKRRDLAVAGGNVETGVIEFSGAEVSGHIIISLNYSGKETRIIWYGEKGTMVYDPITPPSLRVEVYEKVPWTVAVELPHRHTDYDIDEGNNLRYAIADFGEAVMGRTGTNLNRAMAITRILESLATDGSYHYA